jgi:membrane-bound lytic murein transglycosylase D
MRIILTWIQIISLLMIVGTQAHAQQEDSGLAEDTPVMIEDIAGDKDLTGIRPWRAPNYSGQAGSIGWSENAFAVPKGLETNYQFWLDIYTKYTTDQGLLHDSDQIDLVYEVLDFTSLSARTDLNSFQKNRMRTKAVKEAKKRTIAMLKKLQKIKDPSTLSVNEKRIWDAFSNKSGKKKFLDATTKNRLRFQLGQRDRIIQGIFFSGRYLEDFEKIFHEAGIPMELTRLPFVESSFNVMARSKVGASGVWQIMRVTGKPYMMINNTVDKRNLPIEAAKLAVKLFRNNYNLLQSWPLAVTGYNHGAAGVSKLTKIRKTRELGELIQSGGSKKKLGFASRNFYASFLAALEAERNAPKYFGTVYWSKPLVSAEIKLLHPIRWKDVLRWFDGNDKVAQIYNPHITASARKFGMLIPKGAFIYVLADKKDLVSNEFSPPPSPTHLPPPKMEEDDLQAAASGELASAQPAAGTSEENHIYVVARGDTISSISRDFGISIKELLDANKMQETDELPPGTKLKIP